MNIYSRHLHKTTWFVKMAEKDDGTEQTIDKDIVVTKYKMAAELVNGLY